MNLNLNNDTLNVSDIVEEIEEIDEMIDDLIEDLKGAETKEEHEKALSELGEQYEERLPLKAFINDYGDDERMLIADSYFTDYARERASETVPLDGISWDSWPLNAIDWDEAAELLQQDFTHVEINGREFWMESC
jgi:anion-transporting  ArsA/GET3 family ATPase